MCVCNIHLLFYYYLFSLNVYHFLRPSGSKARGSIGELNELFIFLFYSISMIINNFCHFNYLFQKMNFQVF